MEETCQSNTLDWSSLVLFTVYLGDKRKLFVWFERVYHCRVTATATFCLDVESVCKQTEGDPI